MLMRRINVTVLSSPSAAGSRVLGSPNGGGISSIDKFGVGGVRTPKPLASQLLSY